MSAEINLGRVPMCFGNFDAESKDFECKDCPNRTDCVNDLFGMNVVGLVENMERMELLEKRYGLPDWVLEWDSLSEEELDTLKAEEPERYRFYSLLNSGIQDLTL